MLKSIASRIKRFFSGPVETDPLAPLQSVPVDGSAPGILTQNLTQAISDSLIRDLLTERKSERRWRMTKRVLLSTGGVIMFALYMVFYLSNMGFKLGPRSEVVGIVRINGDIGPGAAASGEKVVPMLEKAFKAPNVKAVVLMIDSGGGSPSEAERIYNVIDAQRKATGKPVYSIINNLGASAAYLIALHTDKIYAGNYSLVGSIGAILNGWDFSELIGRFDVRQRIFASGDLKNMMNPFAPMSDEEAQKAKELVGTFGKTFAAEVRKYRGSKLLPDVDYFRGEVWTGMQAKQLGLVDEIGTVDQIIKSVWNLESYDFGPTQRRGGLAGLFASVSDGIADGVRQSLSDSLGSRPLVQ